jgi:hypothetical protein
VFSPGSATARCRSNPNAFTPSAAAAASSGDRLPANSTAISSPPASGRASSSPPPASGRGASAPPPHALASSANRDRRTTQLMIFERCSPVVDPRARVAVKGSGCPNGRDRDRSQTRMIRRCEGPHPATAPRRGTTYRSRDRTGSERTETAWICSTKCPRPWTRSSGWRGSPPQPAARSTTSRRVARSSVSALPMLLCSPRFGSSPTPCSRPTTWTGCCGWSPGRS